MTQINRDSVFRTVGIHSQCDYRTGMANRCFNVAKRKGKVHVDLDDRYL